MTPAPGGWSVYVHVPFCDVRCPYCHFTCFVNRDADLFGRFVDALRREFDAAREELGIDRLATVYFGGGTPTALPPDERGRLARWLQDDLLPLTGDDAEITLEANPESLWPESLGPWVEAGVGRVSLGVQSMQPEVLRFLGRLNTPASNLRALELACSMVPEVSADLIVGTPPDRWAWLHRSIEAITAHPVTHLSAYILEIHADTRFGRDVAAGRWAPLPDDDQAEQYLRMVDELVARGFEAYELSNFAQPGHHSRHNSRYWSRERYLGLGPSAHSYDGGRRWWNERDTRRWCEGVEASGRAVEARETLDWKAVRHERLLLGLRRREGVPSSWLEGQGALVDRLVGAGLLRREDDRVAATGEGWLVLDDLVLRLSGP